MIRIQVLGIPAPQGSKTIRGRNLVESSAALPAWRDSVTFYARQAAKPLPDWAGPSQRPLKVVVIFRLKRPKSHLRPSGEIKTGAPEFVGVRPDLDKYVRATLDGLETAGVFTDGQVAHLLAVKKYANAGQPVGADILVDAIKGAGR